MSRLFCLLWCGWAVEVEHRGKGDSVHAAARRVLSARRGRVAVCSSWLRLREVPSPAAALARQGKKRPGILGTDGTIQTGLYQKECAALGLEAVAPAPDIQRLVMSIIYDEIKQGEKGSREKFAKVDRAIRSAGCDCDILACTELSVFSTYHPLPPFYLDAMMVMAERAVERCGYPLRTI